MKSEIETQANGTKAIKEKARSGWPAFLVADERTFGFQDMLEVVTARLAEPGRNAIEKQRLAFR
ncbi:hypothetical protein CR513_24474, partial [Mucuna pruriens]